MVGDKKKKKKRGGSKRKMTPEQCSAFKSVSEWVYSDQQHLTASSCVVDDFGVQKSMGRGGQKLVFEFHSHTKHGDGFLNPTKLVERTHTNGLYIMLDCLGWSKAGDLKLALTVESKSDWPLVRLGFE